MLDSMKPVDDLASIRADIFCDVPNPQRAITDHCPLFGSL
jgi:hypothetical protein